MSKTYWILPKVNANYAYYSNQRIYLQGCKQEIDMKTFKNVPWVGCCEKCDAERATVQTEKGSEDWFYDGDKVTCENCGHTGVIEADGECAWCVWDEADDSQGCNEEE